MAFVDALTKQLEVPGEPGQWMKLRPLSFLEIETAQIKGYIALMRSVGEISEVEETIERVFEKARAAAKRNEPDEAEQADEDDSEADEVEAAIEEADQDPLKGLDQLTVLRLGIVEWSYDRPLDEANIRLLDEDTARWAATEIVGLRSQEDLEKG